MCASLSVRELFTLTPHERTLNLTCARHFMPLTLSGCARGLLSACTGRLLSAIARSQTPAGKHAPTRTLCASSTMASLLRKVI